MRFLQNILIFTICSTVGPFSANAQTIYATHQSYLDSFPIKYPGVTELNAIVLGNAGATPSDIHDLSPLAQVKTLYDGLIIRNNHHLKTLDGLQNLETVWGLGIAITGNDSLQSLAALQNVSTLHDYLEIKDNPLLTEIGSLDKVDYIDYIEIYDNKNLTIINGLKNLQSADRLETSGNRLKALDFPNLSAIYVGLDIRNEPALTNLLPLANLNYFYGSVAIVNCPRLKNLEGLSIDSASYWVSVIISSNDSLTSIHPLENWDLDTATLWLNYNPMLTKIDFSNTPLSSAQKLDILIRSNQQLKEIKFNALTEARKIRIMQNPALKTIEMPMLKTVTDSLNFIYNQSLESLGDLGSLERVGECFLMSQLPKLKNLHGIEKLKQVDGGVWMYHKNFPNGNIQSFDSLASLCKFTQFGSAHAFFIGLAPVLKNLDGLETFRSTVNFSIGGAQKLEQINGLTNLDTFGVVSSNYLQQIYLADVNSLKSIEPLRDNQFYNLPWAGTSFYINGNDSMEHAALDHFNFGTVGISNCNNLKSVDFPSFVRSWPEQYGLGVGNCPKLTSIDGFSKFKILHNPDAKINILQNASLTDCSAICEMRKTIPTSRFNISGNPFPCDLLTSIEEHVCDTLSAISDLAGKEIGHLLLFPNPANEQLQIDMQRLDFPCEVRVFNQLGQLLIRENLSDISQKIDVSGLPNGIYWAVLPRSNVVGRFIKMGQIP